MWTNCLGTLDRNRSWKQTRLDHASDFHRVYSKTPSSDWICSSVGVRCSWSPIVCSDKTSSFHLRRSISDLRPSSGYLILLNNFSLTEIQNKCVSGFVRPITTRRRVTLNWKLITTRSKLFKSTFQIFLLTRVCGWMYQKIIERLIKLYTKFSIFQSDKRDNFIRVVPFINCLFSYLRQWSQKKRRTQRG